MVEKRNGILLTGATGLVGGELLIRLLASRPFSRIYCIIRSKKLQPFEERLNALIEWLEISDEDAARIVAIEGDVTEKHLGLGDQYEKIASQVAEIFATAANVSFNLELEEARRYNLDSLKHIIDFAKKAQFSGGFQRLNYLSTAYVIGDPSQSPDDQGRPRFRNTYEQSKWEAEQLLQAAKEWLPFTCYRPSVIMGNSKTGRTPNFRVLYVPMRWVWLEGITTLPCDPNIRFDVVPVDYVCDAIVALSIKPQCIGKVYNLTAGPERSITNAEFCQLAVEAGHEWQQRMGEPLTPEPELVPFEKLPDISEEQRKKFEQIARSVMPYMVDELLFEDSETEEVLADTSIECPSLRDYIRNLIYFAIKYVSEKRLIDPRL